ncbi:MAG: hypothetical protein ACT4OP_11515 [Actinomycetota bacterium]
MIAELSHLGLSSICNVLAAIRTARHHHLGGNDVIITVATDGADMYRSEVDRITRRDHPGGYTSSHAEAAIERFLAAGETGDFLELGDVGRRRVFNLGYYTWVEQQGISGTDFEARRDQQWWRRLRPYLETWDAMITDFNERTGVRY